MMGKAATHDRSLGDQHEPSSQPGKVADIPVLETIQERVLWLATRIVDAANRERADAGGIKVGGHQASSASMVSIMTGLWFHHLDGDDLTSVKPHASPVLHAIHYLMGLLDRPYLTMLRSRGGLQAYPSRTKDPDRVDFSTGSVGLGAAAPLFASVTRRYVDEHFGDRPKSRFVSLLGDAELDEGNIWEAIAEPLTHGLGEVMWVVDFNRQSLDRVVPGVRIHQWADQFRAAGWHVAEVKYGQRLQEVFARPGGEHLERWISAMNNEQYQSLFALDGSELRERFLHGAPSTVASAIRDFPDEVLRPLLTNLGGHDLEALLAAWRACDAVVDRPSVVFAYTIKGWGLPLAGNPRNHSALLSGEEIDALRQKVGLNLDNEWDGFPRHHPAGNLAAERGRMFGRRRPSDSQLPQPPHATLGSRPRRAVSTQETFGRVLTSLARNPDLGRYLVSTAPDVTTTTHLVGFVNRVGVFTHSRRRSWSDDPMMKWDEGPEGQHLELGISEMNFFLLLGQLGLARELSGQPLIPIGTVYDPFVLRGLDAFIYGAYSGARFILAGTPSGVSLAPEGGAHQSTITASVGIELPNVTLLEPAYAQAVDWLTCDAVRRLADPSSTNSAQAELVHYLRLSTRPIDQTPFETARARLGNAAIQRQVLAGAYRLNDASDLAGNGAPVVNLAACGAILPGVLKASALLADEGVAAHVIDITSPSRLYRDWRASITTSIRTATIRSHPGSLHGPFALGAPVVSIHDASSHALAWLGTALGAPGVSLGVDQFGQSGDITDLYSIHDIDPGAIVNAALSTFA